MVLVDPIERSVDLDPDSDSTRVGATAKRGASPRGYPCDDLLPRITQGYLIRQHVYIVGCYRQVDVIAG